MVPELLVRTALMAAKTGGVVLTEGIMKDIVKGGVILGLGILGYKSIDTLSDKYNELSIEGHGNEKSVTIKGRRYGL